MRGLLLIAAAVVLPSIAQAMGRMPPPRTQTFLSPNGEYKVVVKPGRAQEPPVPARPAGSELEAPTVLPEKSTKDDAWAAFYRLRPEAAGYEPVSVFKLRNPVAPIQAFLTDGGRSLVTAGEWYRADAEHALVLYSLPKGELVADHAFEHLFGEDVRGLWLTGEYWMEGSTASFAWSEDRVESLRLRLFWGQTLTLRLDNGSQDLEWHDPRFMPEGLTEPEALALLREAQPMPARRGLIRFLGEEGGPLSAEALKGIVESGEPGTLHPAMSAYAKALGPKATPYLLRVFRTHRQPRTRLAAASALGEAVHGDWGLRQDRSEDDPEVVEAYRKAMASDPDPDTRKALVGMYLTYFFPRCPDTAEFFQSLAAKEKDKRVKAELLKFSEEADKMYPRPAGSRDSESPSE